MKNTKRMTLALLTLIAFQSQGKELFAQSTTLQGPIPFIMIVSDTSASMEFTDKGSRYPKLTGTGDSNLPVPSGIAGEPNEWEPGTFMDIDPTNQNSGPKRFGACLVWEPNSCTSYRRPSWNANINPGGVPQLNGEWTHQYGSGDVGEMRNRFTAFMRGSAGSGAVRFQASDQPRHVTIKEVLTGDMILRPQNFFGAPPVPLTSLNREEYGPGCWFVPRQRDATIQPDDDQDICDGITAFEELIDFDESSPHFQEVYDGQLNNGLMDSLAGTAIFAVVGFDGYKKDIDWEDFYNDFMNDDVGAIPGYMGRQEGQNCTNIAGDTRPCYNMGIAKIVAPKQLDIPSRFLPEVSRFSQVVIRDYGYLHRGDSDADWRLTPKSSGEENDRNVIFGETFSDGFDVFYRDHELGKQPLAAATPIAAAMQDIQGFFESGQGTGSKHDDPINDDDFSECRPKHVILITDGAPSPERGDGVNDTLAFGHDEKLSPYGTSESEISDLVNDPFDRIEPPGMGFSPLSSVRVHVVGMNIGDDDAIRKLTDMAKAGNTCAGISLGANWRGTLENDGSYSCPNKSSGPNRACLIPPPGGGSYPYPPADGTLPVDCFYPALILDINDRDQLQAALSLLFNDIVDGAAVSTRTRAVLTNEIQMESTEPGGGQSRVFSGVVTGGSQYWKGILNRQTQSCLNGDFKTVALHEEIGNQVSITATGQALDSRRIFTSLAEHRRYDYIARAPKLDLNGGTLTTTSSMFPSTFKFMKAVGQDEFKGTQLSIMTTDTLDSRIPFEAGAMESVFPFVMSISTLLNVGTEERGKEVINIFSGRIPEKLGAINGGVLVGENGRAMGGILNSNPVLVAPPSLDLPIESYRQFKAHYADRHTMLYANSMDGMLHAIHNGEREVKVRDVTAEGAFPGNDVDGPAVNMREAWAYIPQMFHTQLDAAAGAQAYLMDGTPIVQDVRLCRAQISSNFSSLCKDSAKDGGLEPWEQWKTVLVQGAGLAGSGYYAMDITRPGGRTINASGAVQLHAPDPVPMWELTPAYEVQQLRQIINIERLRIASGVLANVDHGSCGDADAFAQSSMMGISVSEPAIANLLIKYNHAGVDTTEQRPVVVFGGGATRSEAGCAPTGRAIYVVDLQTGSIIRRFTSYHKANVETPFSTISDPIQLTGSPTLYDGSPGSVATRGFIGGSGGRLFRMDFVDPNPVNWKIDLFFDPALDSDVQNALTAAGTNGLSGGLGPAAFKPAVASTKDKSIIVTYGLGDVGDSVANNEAQVVIALRDRGATLLTFNADNSSALEWVEALEPNEKLMGNPLTFDGATYWASYKLPNGDACEPGLARIYGVGFEGDGNGGAFGIWDQVPSIASANDIEKETATGGKWWGPSETTLIRGLTLTLGNPCNVDDIGTANPTYSDDSSRRPQLIAQTSGQKVDSTLKNVNGDGNLGAGNPVVDRLVVDIRLPESRYQPLYWTAISY